MFVDSTSAINRVRDDALGPGQRFGVAAIDVCLRILARDNDVTIRWVPAHSGASGNEVADEYAKSAATGDAPEEEIPEGYGNETSLTHDESCHRDQVPRGGGVDLETCEARATVQAPPGTRPPSAPAQAGEEDPRRPLIPAPVWPRGNRDPPAAAWDDDMSECVCVILYFYPATCGPKGHGSGSAAALEQRQ